MYDPLDTPPRPPHIFDPFTSLLSRESKVEREDYKPFQPSWKSHALMVFISAGIIFGAWKCTAPTEKKAAAQTQAPIPQPK